jgi:hypothetical protein
MKKGRKLVSAYNNINGESINGKENKIYYCYISILVLYVNAT